MDFQFVQIFSVSVGAFVRIIGIAKAKLSKQHRIAQRAGLQSSDASFLGISLREFKRAESVFILRRAGYCGQVICANLAQCCVGLLALVCQRFVCEAQKTAEWCGGNAGTGRAKYFALHLLPRIGQQTLMLTSNFIRPDQ